MGKISWLDIVKPVSTQNGTEFLRMQSGKTYRIRFVSPWYMFYRLYKDVNKSPQSAICDEQTYDQLPYGAKASERYAAYVLEGSDSKIKVLELSRSVVMSIDQHVEMYGFQPEDLLHGGLYRFDVTGEGICKKYKVKGYDGIPLSEEQLNAVSSQTTRPLSEFFRTESAEQIVKRLGL
jgi:hypothetical protein